MSGTKVDFSDQQALWNGPAGQAWVDTRDVLDGLFRRFEERLADAVAAAGARDVLDVGCGTGSTTLAMAVRIGGGGRCTGIDISAPMVAEARARAERAGAAADFIVGDAQRHDFVPASFDIIGSRFGVMFFDDPVRAFANLLAAARGGAGLRCFAWRSAAENPFMTTAERAAAPFLPDLPIRSPDGPGQFAFADAQRVTAILQASGWREIDIAPVDVDCAMPEAALGQYMTRLGPVGLILGQADEGVRTLIIDRLREGFAPFVRDGEVRFTAACWEISARAG